MRYLESLGQEGHPQLLGTDLWNELQDLYIYHVHEDVYNHASVTGKGMQKSTFIEWGYTNLDF